MSWQIASGVGMAAIGSVTSMAAGDARAGAYEDQARQYGEAATEAQIETQQQEVARRGRFRQLHAANMAELQTRGLDSSSPSFGAIDNSNLDAMSTDIGNIRYMGMAKRRRLLLGQADAYQQAHNARTAGMIGALTSFVSMGQQVAGSWSGSGGRADNATRGFGGYSGTGGATTQGSAGGGTGTIKEKASAQWGNW